MGREILLTISVSGPSGERTELEAVVNTDFTGNVVPRRGRDRDPGLPFVGRGDAVLADGRAVEMRHHRGRGLWHGRERGVQVLATEGSPLVGMTRLRRSPLTVEVAPEGEALVEELS